MALGKYDQPLTPFPHEPPQGFRTERGWERSQRTAASFQSSFRPESSWTSTRFRNPKRQVSLEGILTPADGVSGWSLIHRWSLGNGMIGDAGCSRARNGMEGEMVLRNILPPFRRARNESCPVASVAYLRPLFPPWRRTKSSPPFPCTMMSPSETQVKRGRIPSL